MNCPTFASFSRHVHAAALLLSCVTLCDAARAQLPVGSYLLEDPVRGILGIATSWQGPGGGNALTVEWIDPLGATGIVVLWFDPSSGFYIGEMYTEYYFHTNVLNGVAQYSLTRQTADGGMTVVTSGTIR